MAAFGTKNVHSANNLLSKSIPTRPDHLWSELEKKLHTKTSKLMKSQVLLAKILYITKNTLKSTEKKTFLQHGVSVSTCA